jgi:hypothetical protein
MKWTHFDPNLPASFDDGLAALSSGQWPTPKTRAIRDLQALQAVRAALIGHLLGGVSYTTDSSGVTSCVVAVDLTSTVGERADAARALVAACRAYWLNAGLPALADTDETTTAPVDTGAIPFVAITAVVVGGAVVGWIGAKAFEYLNTKADIEAKANALKASDAAALKVLSDHMAEEKASGGIKPFSPAEQQVLDKLNAQAQKLTEAVSRPVSPSFFDSVPWYGWAIAAGVGAILILPRFSGGGVTVVQPAKAA